MRCLRLGLVVAYVALLIVGAFGLLYRLDARLLWGDEAWTAVLGERITRFGVPVADDGRNPLAQLGDPDGTRVYGLWTWTPWLDEYLVAGSFLVFGPTTAAARLPFACIGLAGIALLSRLAYRAYGSHEVALSTLALSVTCALLLLHARQARYYAVLVFASAWLMWGIERSWQGRPLVGGLHVAGSLAALFHSNYIAVPAPLLALVAVAGLARRREGRVPGGLLGGLLGGLGGFIALSLPWLVYTGTPAGQVGELSLSGFPEALSAYARRIHFHVVPLVVLALPVLGWVTARQGCSRPAVPAAARALEHFAWALVAGHLLVVSAIPLHFSRYLMPLLPPLLLLSAALLVRHVRPAWPRRGVVFVLATSNALAVGTGWVVPSWSEPPHRLASPYLRFVDSIRRDSRERLDDVLAYLAREAKPGDAVFVADSELPLIFYTELRIVDARFRPFPDPPPEWILSKSASGLGDGEILPPPHVRRHYREIDLTVRASARGGSRPDPHAFAHRGSAETETLRIYRLRERTGVSKRSPGFR